MKIYQIISVIFILIIFFQLLKYRFVSLEKHEIVFKRIWIYKTTIRLQKNDIDVIYYCTLIGKPFKHIVKTKSKKYNLPANIDYEKLKGFAVRNNITLIHDEGYHGGGEVIWEKHPVIKASAPIDKQYELLHSWDFDEMEKYIETITAVNINTLFTITKEEVVQKLKENKWAEKNDYTNAGLQDGYWVKYLPDGYELISQVRGNAQSLFFKTKDELLFRYALVLLNKIPKHYREQYRWF